ncbi:MAG: HAD-IIIC family phosphatase [Betaproteobacteria bacterium]
MPVAAAPAEKAVKCVVWDLDHTLWDGVLSEGDEVRLKPGIVELLQALDARGILNSVASKNTHDDAMRKLQEFGVAGYFLYPQIDWSAKSAGVGRIQQQLNIGLDSILFIDDQPFERDEVAAAHPAVRCVAAEEFSGLLDHPCIRSVRMTEDAGRRRKMYLEDAARKRDEENYSGTPEEFLATLDMRFTISRAREADLLRAEELTLRTNQLNSTGITYSIEDLRGFMHSDTHSLLLCELIDRYGSYGQIGLALVRHAPAHDRLLLLLMSCRTASRGVGSVLLTYLMRQAAAVGKTLQADFLRTERNRQMLVTYQFAGFSAVQRGGNGDILFEHDLKSVPPFPSYIDVQFQP